MRTHKPLLHGVLFIMLNIASANIQRSQRSAHGDQRSSSSESSWGRRGNIEKGSDGSKWASNPIGSVTKRWGSDATGQGWSPAETAESQSSDYDYSDEWQQWSHPAQKIGVPPGGNSTEKHLESILRGVPGMDFPNYNTIPDTQFDCSEQTSRGYYGDVKAQCQVFHICQPEGRKDSFLCPLGTIFNQKYFVCDWWFNFNCTESPQYYQLNEQVYKDGEGEAMEMRPWNPPGVAKGMPRSSNPPVFRGKSLDEWASKGAKRSESADDKMPSQSPAWNQNNVWKGHVGKVNANVVWNRTTDRKGTSVGAPSISSAGRTQMKSAALLANKNGNLPTNQNIGSWSGRVNGDRTKPNTNEIKQSSDKTPRPVGFGMRTKSSSDRKTSKPGSWKANSEAVTEISPSYGRKAVSHEITNRGNGGWHGIEHSPRRAVLVVTTLSPTTVIRPTGTRGVWEQESTSKTSSSNYMWKFNGSYQKGTIKKSGVNNLKSDATERSELVASSGSSSFGKRKGVTPSDGITTQQTAKSEPVQFTEEISHGYESDSSENLEFTRNFVSTPLSAIKESHGHLAEYIHLRPTSRASTLRYSEADDFGKHEHLLTTTGTLVPVSSVTDNVISQSVMSSTAAYGIRNPKKQWITNVIPESKNWN